MLSHASLITPVPVTDLDRARRFYVDTLGLPVLFEDPAQRIVVIGVGAAMLELGEHEDASAGHHSCAVFHLSDPDALETAAAALRAAGVELERRVAHVELEWDGQGVGTFGPRRTAWFRDPDGNLLQLYAQEAVAG